MDEFKMQIATTVNASAYNKIRKLAKEEMLSVSAVCRKIMLKGIDEQNK